MTNLRTRIAPLLVVAAIATPMAQAQQYGINLGGSIGVYIPTNKVIRDSFGSQILSFGIGPVGSTSAQSGKLTSDISLLTANKNGNRLLIIPYTLGYEMTLGDAGAMAVPYVRGGIGLAYYDYDVTIGESNVHGRKFSSVGVAEAGVIIGKRLRLSGKYDFFSKQSGLDFNGWQLAATFAVAKF